MAQFGRGSVRLFFKGDPTLVGNWSFDEETGTIAKDLSGKGNNGTLTNGPLWVGGKFSGALSFDGVNDYVTMGNNSMLGPSNTITVMAWVKTPSSFSGLVFPQIVTRSSSGSTGFNLYVVYEEATGNTIPYFSFILLTTTGNWGSDWARDTIPIAVNTWYFVVGMRDNNGFVSIWVNGTLRAIDTAITSGSINYGSTPEFAIGRKASGSYWRGIIDEVAIFSRALSPKEIQSYYNWAIGKSTPIIYTPRKNASVLNVGETALPTIKARRGLIMSM